MKWLALMLLAANLGVWFVYSQQPELRVVNEPSPSGASRLILMQELNFTERNSLRIEQPQVEPATPVARVDSASEPDESDPFNLIRQPDELQDTPDQQRLRELQGQCHLIKADEQILPGIAERFDALDIRQWMAREITETPGPMMVYVSPFETAREAAVEVSVLRSEGVDSFIIADGELANGISVGVFGSEANAATRAAQIEAIGYSAETYQYSIEESVSVLNVDAVSADVLGQSFWTQLEADFPSMARQQNSCIEVASQDNFQ